ncbi:response regulator [Achromobacter sp. F4_2707]|uniref:response regulator n=1 Tax=Achromobacter sp. F4_2707 TaxID=3114286 RepID=UPI0039C62A24
MSLRVLVVDDDPLCLRIAARLLRSLGHGGALAPTGENALSLLTKKPFDLMLLDINMPKGLSGQDTLLELRRREQPGQPRLPVVMLSGQYDDSTCNFFTEAGADGFLSKPLSVAALSNELERLQRLKRL